MRIAALDVATQTGVAIGEPGGRPALSTVKLRRDLTDGHIDLFAYATGWIDRFLSQQKVDVLALEMPVAIHDSTLVFGLRGIIAGHARRSGARVIEATVAQWRLYALGDGKLPGPKAKQRAVDLVARLGWWDTGDLTLTHDAAEAACLWLWGCSRVAPKEVQRHEPLFLGGLNAR
jgi:hypothetical protein